MLTIVPRMVRAWAALALLVFPSMGWSAEAPAGTAPASPAGETWLPTSTPGLRGSLVNGRPDRPGPYTVAFQMDEGARISPRRHSDSRILTVVSGRMLVGRGESFDEKRLEPVVPGSSITIEAGHPYFARAAERTVYRVSGTGPTETTRVGTDPPIGGSSPTATWLALRNAFGSGDFRAYAALVSPASHPELLCEPCFILLFFSVEGGPVGPREFAELEPVAIRHGARLRSSPDGGNGLTFCSRAGAESIADKAGLFSELMDYLRGKRIGPILPPFLVRDLADVKEEAATATAKDGTGHPVAFERTAAGWFVRWSRPSCLDAWDADLGRPPTPGTSR
jgi:quercetin dioxygenase-like cupin family protein